MQVKAVLLDLSGVVYQGGAIIPGASEAINALRLAKVPIRFVTNTTRSSKEQILVELSKMGIEIGEEEIFTPVGAAVDYLGRANLSPYLLVHPAISEEFSACPKGSDRAVVVGDAGNGFCYQALNGAFRVLAEGAPLLALAKNRSFRDADGGLSLDAGAFVAALEYATGQHAVVLGKPSAEFFEAALSSVGCVMTDAVMVGDDADADVSGALSVGVGAALLVRTGKYRDGDEILYEHSPTSVVADLTEAVAWILDRV